MIFPNIQIVHADLSAQHPFMEREHGWTNVLPHRPQSGEVREVRLGVVEACTATDREIEDRMADGEFSFDVIDEHTSWLWFCDRQSFRAAWRVARLVCNRNVRLTGIVAGEECFVRDIDGQEAPGLSVLASAHHVAASQQSDSPERGGASVMGGERAALPATYAAIPRRES